MGGSVSCGDPSMTPGVVAGNFEPKRLQPGSCRLYGHPVSMFSLGIRMLVEETMNGKCEYEFLDVFAGAQNTDEYRAINPFTQVPGFVDSDGKGYGESNAILKLIGTKYCPKYYPEKDRSFIDFALEAKNNRLWMGDNTLSCGLVRIIYPTVGFSNLPKSQKRNDDTNALLKIYEDTFLKGKFIGGSKPCIADFALVPLLVHANAEMVTHVTGYKLPARWQTYIADFKATVKSAKLLSDCDGFSIEEFYTMQFNKFKSEYKKPILYGLPLSTPTLQNFLLLAHEMGQDGFEFKPVDLMKGENKEDWFMEKSPYGQIPCLEDSDGSIVCESNTILRHLGRTKFPQYYPEADRAKIDWALDLKLGRLYDTGTGETKGFGWLTYPHYGFKQCDTSPEKLQMRAEAFAADLKVFEDLFLEDDMKFFGGDTLNLVDFAMAPWICCLVQPFMENASGFVLSEKWKTWLQNFREEVPASAIFGSADGWSIEEFSKTKEHSLNHAVIE